MLYVPMLQHLSIVNKVPGQRAGIKKFFLSKWEKQMKQIVINNSIISDLNFLILCPNTQTALRATNKKTANNFILMNSLNEE